jgi:ferrochelatase
VLVSFGGPERTEDVMPFLRRVTAGRNVPEERVQAVAAHYSLAGGASPVNARCRDLMARLRPGLVDVALRPYWGNRNWHPLLDDTVAQMRDDGAQRALAFVTSAYGGYSSCRQYIDDIAAARAKVGPHAPEIDKLRLYYNHPGWVGSWAASLSGALRACRAGPDPTGPDPTGGTEVLFSAHSIPVAMAERSPYTQHVTETARLTAQAAWPGRWRVVWQSRSGAPGTPWLGPDVCEVLGTSGARTTVVVPIGFACDNMEIIYDLDVEASAAAARAGVLFERAATPSASPMFVAMVHDLVRERLGLSDRRESLGTSGPWPDNCPEWHCLPSARMPGG